MNQEQDILPLSFVLDSNIFISALIKDGLTRKIILKSGFCFYVPYIIIEEVRKYKSLIMQKASFSELDFELLFFILLEHMILMPTSEFVSCMDEAEQIMQNIDIDDSLYLALALSYNLSLWSNDNHFNAQDKVRVYLTKDMAELCCFSK